MNVRVDDAAKAKIKEQNSDTVFCVLEVCST